MGWVEEAARWFSYSRIDSFSARDTFRGKEEGSKEDREGRREGARKTEREGGREQGRQREEDERKLDTEQSRAALLGSPA